MRAGDRVTDVDVAVIGGGIVGLATARAVQVAAPGSQVVVVEKERGIAHHQTGRNSGVIHSGIYYTPGSHKAELTARGRRLLVELCREHGIRHELCGKVVVATTPEDVPRLIALEKRAHAHGLAVSRLDAEGLRAAEPHARGLAALAVPETGIVDFLGVCGVLADLISSDGGAVLTGWPVTRLDDTDRGVGVHGPSGTIRASRAVNCAGLYSDRVAALGGTRPVSTITPFRGEYHGLRTSARSLVRNLIYPVPDPRFPFLGVHLTRGVDGEVHAGPNAVLALAREGYRWRDVDLGDVTEMARNPAVWRLARRYWRTGLGEVWRSASLRATVRALQRLVPDLTVADLEPYPAGVRAQALRADGTLVDDFDFADGRRTVHVVNAPSPAATASLAIGEVVASRVLSLR